MTKTDSGYTSVQISPEDSYFSGTLWRISMAAKLTSPLFNLGDGLPVLVFRLSFVVFPVSFSQFANLVSLEFVLMWKCRRFWREKRIESSINQAVNTRYSLNFIRLLRVVITPSVSCWEEKTTRSNRMNFRLYTLRILSEKLVHHEYNFVFPVLPVCSMYVSSSLM